MSNKPIHSLFLGVFLSLVSSPKVLETHSLILLFDELIQLLVSFDFCGSLTRVHSEQSLFGSHEKELELLTKKRDEKLSKRKNKDVNLRQIPRYIIESSILYHYHSL